MSYTIRPSHYGWDVISPSGSVYVEATTRHPRSKGQAAAIATALTMAEARPARHGKAIADLMLEGHRPERGTCGCGAPDAPYRPCPYSQDIEGVDRLLFLCDECYADRCGSI